MSTKPSQILQVDNKLAAFLFDRAVWIFGTAIQNEIEAVRQRKSTSKSSQKQLEMWENQVVQRWIAEPNEKGRYRDPAKRG